MPTVRGKGLQIDVQVTRHGKVVRYRQIIETSLPDAYAYEACVKADLLAGRKPTRWTPSGLPAAVTALTLGDALQNLWGACWAETSSASVKLSHIKTCIGFFGSPTDLRDITVGHCDEFVRKLRSEGLAASTIRQKCGVMVQLFKHHERMGDLKNAPRFNLPKIGDNTRLRLVSPVELTQMQEAIEPVYAQILRFLMDTGIRRKELQAVDMKNLRGDLLTLVSTKNGEHRTIPLTRLALECIHTCSDAYGSLPFYWVTSSRLRDAWNSAKDKIGLGADLSFIPYALRHTCATMLYSKTKDLLIVQKWLGHADIKVTLRYAKLMPGDLTKARDLLDLA